VKVLVTGATGFVGRHLVEALLTRGCQVRAVARNAEAAASLPWINAVEFIAADIHADELNIPALTDGIDALAHLAWPGLPNYQALFHFEHNLMADYRFIKGAVEAGVPQVLVTGTCFEYGLQSGPLSEQTEARPSNPYGLAKNTLRLFLENLQQVQPFTLQWARLFTCTEKGRTLTVYWLRWTGQSRPATPASTCRPASNCAITWRSTQPPVTSPRSCNSANLMA